MTTTHTKAGKSGSGAASNNIPSPDWTCSLLSDVKAKANGVIKRGSYTNKKSENNKKKE
jgi:hypothetical protein